MSERLINLLTNPYTWIFLIAIFILAYTIEFLMVYIRKFYPKKLREKMEKEEACTLKMNQKPEMKHLRRKVLIGFVVSVMISYIMAYYIFPSNQDQLKTFTNFFIGCSSLVAGYFMIYEYKINKDKNCNEVIVGHKFMKWSGIFSLIVFVILSVIVVMNEFK